MKLANRTVSSALLVITCLALIACSGVPGGNSGGGSGGGTGSYTIGGTISGLTGTGLVLQNNNTDNLTVLPGATTFTFKSTVKSGGKYAVTVFTQPGSPSQTCTVTVGSGTATANVSSVVVACTTNPVTATIGGTVTNLANGTGVILQNNGGDSLTVTGNGPFQFKTPVTGPTDAYAVTVLTQPTNPTQICTVTNGSGTASGNVTNVGVNCVPSYTIGGTVSGLLGSGLILQNSATLEQLPISAATGNQAFTFVNLVPTGTAYTVSIFAQPTGPVQTCDVTPSTATGTATNNVTSVVVTCPAVTYSVGGTVVGAAGQNLTTLPYNNPLTDSSFTLQNNTGDNLTVPQNGPFTFATPVALNGAFNASVFTPPSTQFEACWTWNYKGVVTGSVTDIVVDCGHNDWTFIDGTKTAGTIAAPQYGAFPLTPPTLIPNPYTNTPGARDSAAGWADAAGNLWLFGGLGWELAGNQQPDTLYGNLNDLWVCPMQVNQCQWQLVGGYDPNGVGSAIIAMAQHEDNPGAYGNPGTLGLYPGGRWGSATWIDNAGNLWIFGGQGVGIASGGLLSDLWEYTRTPSTPVTKYGAWTLRGGSGVVNQPGTYAGTPYPGARWGSVFFTDNAGNFWMFGGYGFDGSGNVGFLNDLWELNNGSWTFVSGSALANQSGAYGTQGMPSASNVPGGRQTAVGWADLSGNLWLFGGEGEDSNGTASGILNDLWMYNITSNQWTWVMGAQLANQTGVYEAQPAIGPVNTVGAAGTCGLTVGYEINNQPVCPVIDTTAAAPGSRWGATGWTDVGGNLWLFGGWGQDATSTNGNGFLNDLWVYTPSATAGQPGTWVWVKGSSSGNQNGVYGPATRPYSTYEIWTPGARRGATRWVDSLGALWMFGGQGYDSTSTNGNGYLNDLWRYVPYPYQSYQEVP